VLHSGLTASVPLAATSHELIAARLRNHLLCRPKKTTPADVVQHFGAMQAQDFPAAVWAIGLRAPGCHSADVEHAFNEGKILRTHLLRPTWHFVAPADIRWMLALSAPRVHATNAYYYRQSGLDAKVVSRACAMIHRVLDGAEPMTRAELAVPLKRAKVPADGLKLAYLMMHAELEGVICSGPRRGRQFTYALLDERAPAGKTLDRPDAIVLLAKRYFTSHGPATLRDFVWWSGLTVKDARLGIEGVKPALQKDAVEGCEYWGTSPRGSATKGCTAFLLPNYDEYLIAYKDRAPVIDPGRAANIVARSGGAFSHHLVVDGRLAGSWTREEKPNSVEIQVAPYFKLTPAQSRAVSSAADCYAEFLGVPVSFSMT
jgi:hypothetical protein